MLYNREVSASIGRQGESGLQISNNRIVFSVSKPGSGEKNTADIEIYNLSKDTRNRIRKEGEIIIVKAGYSTTGAKIIFTGDIQSTINVFESADVITQIEAVDGQNILSELKLSLSYKEGVSSLQILKDVIKQSDIVNKVNLDLLNITDKKFANSFSFEGRIKTVLDKLTADLDLKWSIQNNELKITRTGGDDQTRAILITPDTGLIGSPQQVKDVRESTNIEKNIDGFRIKSLLQPTVEPDGRVALQSRDVEERKIFRVEEVDHYGDTHGADWISNIIVSEIYK